MRRSTRPVLFAAAIGAMVLMAPRAPLRAAPVTAQTVQDLLKEGVNELISIRSQRGAHDWWDYPGNRIGGTGIILYALQVSGLPLPDGLVDRGMQFLVDQQIDSTYNLACALMAAKETKNPGRYRQHMARWANALIKMQLPGGNWDYGEMPNRAGDNSNTQFAVLGLQAAVEAGLSVDRKVWDKVHDYFERTAIQNANRTRTGWEYRKGQGASISMTSAGIASMLIAREQLGKKRLACRSPKSDLVEAGIEWLGDQIAETGLTSLDELSGHWKTYTAYAIERVGILSGRRFIGGHDWYREGVAGFKTHFDLQKIMHVGADFRMVDVAFMVLFLAKGSSRTLVNKLVIGSDWNSDPKDCAEWTKLYQPRLAEGEKCGWQTVLSDDGSGDTPEARARTVGTWLSAPILYMNGHDAIPADARFRKCLASFIASGGTLVAAACCFEKTAFEISLREVLATMYPGNALEPLPSTHAIHRGAENGYNVWNDLRELGIRPVEGLGIHCRVAVVFSPLPFCCGLDPLCPAGDKLEKSARFTLASQHLAVNIADFCVGVRGLSDKFTEFDVTDGKAADGTVKVDLNVPRGALVIGQLRYDGDWKTDSLSLPNLMERLRTTLNMKVALQPVPIAATDPQLYRYPIVYITGHEAFALTDDEKRGLAAYVSRGGFLFADSCCGETPFTDSAKKLFEGLLLDARVEQLPADHVIRSEPLPLTARNVVWRPAALAKGVNAGDPPSLIGLTTKDGHLVGVLSDFNLGCAMDGHPCPMCLGYEAETAFRIATNVVSYALSE